MDHIDELTLNETIQKLNFLVERAGKQKKRMKRLFLTEALQKLTKIKDQDM